MIAFANKLFRIYSGVEHFCNFCGKSLRSLFSSRLFIVVSILSALLVTGCDNPGMDGSNNNSPYRLVDVRRSAESMGLKVDEVNTAFAKLKGDSTTVYVYAEPDGRVMVNGIEIAKSINIISDTVTIYMPVSVENKLRGAVRYDDAMAAKLGAISRKPKPKPAVVRRPEPAPVIIPKGKGVVLIDPGHGGTDPGAIGRKGTREKHVVLSISKSLAAELSDMGYTVHMTRTTDDFITLDGRVVHANKLKPDIFVSIHADSAGRGNTSAHGMTIFVPKRGRNYKKSLLACELVENSAGRYAHSSRGVRKHDINLRVLEKTRCPAMLIEVGFLSNPREEALLSQAAYRKKMARGIAAGVDKYLKRQ